MKNFVRFMFMSLLLLSSSVLKAEETTDDVCYSLVTDESQVYDGAKVLVVGVIKHLTPVKYVTLTEHNTNNYGATVIDLNSDGTITPDSTVRVLTLKKGDNGWLLYDTDGYLYAAGGQKNNYLKANSTITNDCYLSLDFSSDDYSVFAKFLKTKASSNVLGCYEGTADNYCVVSCYSKKTSTEKPIWLYVQNSAKTLDETDADLASSLAAGEQNFYVKRTFYSDGWNTWCMPFGITQEKLANVLGEGTEVAKYSSLDGHVMRFTTETGDLEAGTPYLVKAGKEVANPHFLQVTVEEAVSAKSVEIDGYSFCGTFAPYEMAGDGTELFLNASNKLSKPAAGKNKMRGLRAYFKVPSDENAAKVSFMDNTTGVDNAACKKETNSRIYTLVGGYVSGDINTLPSGIYLKDGKKIYVK